MQAVGLAIVKGRLQLHSPAGGTARAGPPNAQATRLLITVDADGSNGYRTAEDLAKVIGRAEAAVNAGLSDIEHRLAVDAIEY
ncbi:hypothetical protein ACWD7C_21425 [Streptomyces sp. NPDC005134]|uniref:hypothetical protein n=1 Tax=unclassified Streptomyces TaxID=2593676 RepID=UPI0033A1F9D7